MDHYNVVIVRLGVIPSWGRKAYTTLESAAYGSIPLAIAIREKLILIYFPHHVLCSILLKGVCSSIVDTPRRLEDGSGLRGDLTKTTCTSVNGQGHCALSARRKQAISLARTLSRLMTSFLSTDTRYLSYQGRLYPMCITCCFCCSLQ